MAELGILLVGLSESPLVGVTDDLPSTPESLPLVLSPLLHASLLPPTQLSPLLHSSSPSKKFKTSLIAVASAISV